MKNSGEISPQPPPAAPGRRASRFLEWIWFAWVAWLPFLIPMFIDLFHGHPTLPQLLVTFPSVAIFVVLYVWTAWRLARLLNGTLYSLDSLDRLWWIPVVILSALATLLTLLNGNAWLGLFIYTSAITGGLLRNKSLMAVIVLVLLDQLAFFCAHATSDNLANLIQGGLLIPATGVTTLGLSRAVMTARELQRAREEIARLAVSEERLRIARDLHDLLGHNLSLIALKSELAGRLVKIDPERAVEEIHDIEQVAREALSETRDTISGYRQPTLLAELHAAQEILAAAGITCDCEAENKTLPASIEAVLASVVREGVTNVIRHSRAKHCIIRVTQDTRSAGIEIVDDGRMKTDTLLIHSGTSGSGLKGLSERVAAHRGQFEAGANPDGGFRLFVTLPLRGAGAVQFNAASSEREAVIEDRKR
jgi:two-component system sensor histidine kinase DesK